MGVTHEGPHQPYWQSGVIQRCERRFGGERGRGRVTQREREKERIDYADHIMQTCIYRWSGVCMIHRHTKALYPLCTGHQSLQIMYYSYMHYAHIMGN